ncbi:DsbA family protein [Streptomyces thermolineatus]|uniref:DsbA family protein n=2 Tax=Streptomyces thermolineatus TaxID=44033 RepID=A0ABN3MM40_9ACTN
MDNTMSSRNNWENKQSARERMRIERERQAKRDKTRRQLLAGGAVVAVLAIAGGIGVAVASMGEDDRPLVVPANATGENGTTVVYGDKNAKNTVDVYEDMRCPFCAQFEQANGKTLTKLADDESLSLKVEYNFGTFIDSNAGGEGSTNALTALGAALNESTDAFVAYHQVLFENHPEETDDKYGDDAYLVELAQKVPALKGNKDFEKAVKDGTYEAWAAKVSEKFNENDISGTPTVEVNGEKIEVLGSTGPVGPEEFTKQVKDRLKD